MDISTIINTSEASKSDFDGNNSFGNSSCSQTFCASNVERVIWGCFLAIITVASVLGNFMVIYAVLVKNQFRNKRFAFLLLLIVSDFAIGIVMMPLYFVNLFVRKFFETSHNTCLLMALLFTFITMFSYLCIATLALERYIMLKFPLKHRHWFKKSVVVGVITAVILMSAIGAVLPVFYSLPATYNAKLHVCIFNMRGKAKDKTLRNIIIQLVFLGILWFTLIFCSLAVVAIIWKRRKFLPQISPQVSIESTSKIRQHVHSLTHHSTEIRSTIHTLSVAFVVLGCCLPVTIAFVCDLMGYHWSERSLMTTLFIFFGKSVLNPLINAFLHTRLRQHLLRVFCCKFQIQ